RARACAHEEPVIPPSQDLLYGMRFSVPFDLARPKIWEDPLVAQARSWGLVVPRCGRAPSEGLPAEPSGPLSIEVRRRDVNAVIRALEHVYASLPLAVLEVWGRFGYLLGFALMLFAFGRFTMRPGGQWGLGRERQTWDSRALVSIA